MQLYQLEYLDYQPRTAVTPGQPPILFVHGAWHGAWCWAENFLPWFQEQGYQAGALSLRGHGESAGRAGLRWHRINDYAIDVESVIKNKLTTPPVIVGHSMGGHVVQKVMERARVPLAGAVLLASLPPAGAMATFLRLTARFPFSVLLTTLQLHLGPLVRRPELTRYHFFSESISANQLNRYHARMQPESFLAFLDMLLFNRPQPKKARTNSPVPMLVSGAANDTVFRPDQVRATARAYGVEAQIFKNMAHDMMLDADWQSVAIAIQQWIQTECRK
ncbi:MAG: alpha/beta fold hydrolase [Leptospiraceae bacterium]|nr:alpha/beta fold hydrolase [Leptospiraceae bacterium]